MLKKILKWCAWIAGSAVTLLLLACTLIVWILTPGKLTPMVEREASRYLDADVKLARVELTFWKTFPRMQLEVDSLQVISRSLGHLPQADRANLPADADSLLSIRHFNGSLNVVKLLAGKIALHDVVFDRPAVNIVQVTESVANWRIFPETEEETDTTPISVPDISINSFRIVNSGPLRFRSLIDSLDVSARLQDVSCDGADAPRYSIAFRGDMRLPFLSEFRLSELTFGLDGTLRWHHDTPLAVEADNMHLTLDDYRFDFSTALDFSGEPAVTRFTGSIDAISIEQALKHLPPQVRPLAEPLKTDMKLSATVEFTRPWVLADTILPSLKATLEIPDCRAQYQTLRFSEFAGQLEVDLDGSDINRSTFHLNKFHIVGAGVNLDLNLRATDIVKDPNIAGNFRGTVDLGRIPPRLRSRIPVHITGLLSGNADFRLRMSDLSEANFHRLYADGELMLRNISADAPGMMQARMRLARLQFGTDNSFVAAGGQKVDSLLQVSLKIDTLWADGMGMNLELKNFRAGAGTVNRQGSADTTEINPFGGYIAMERLKFDSTTDSMRVRLRDAAAGGSLRRFKGEARSPLMNLKVAAGRLLFGQQLGRFALRDADLDLTVHMRRRKHHRAPNAPASGVGAPAAAPAGAPGAAAAQPAYGDVDLTLDSKDRNFMRNWDFSGHIRAGRGSFATPYFPLRNRLRDINLTFSSDSVRLKDLTLRSGQSDFRINGTITNLRRALTARRNNTLGVQFDIVSDTINVNQIVQALFAGPALAQQTPSENLWSDDDTDTDVDTTKAVTDTLPLLMPRNIDAHLRVSGANVLYSDLVLHRFSGDLLLFDGALNLRDLSAATDIGSISLNALYQGAQPDSLSFGMGMKVDRFRLDHLETLVPAIDSIMPLMESFAGIVNADVAVTTDVERNMDINLASLRAAIRIAGDSLVLLDPETFKTVSKWLLFKDKKRNMIDHMEVEAVVENNAVTLYPFIFNIDRYRLGVMGHNDMAMNLNYHISVLKSPIPFKFGINIKGTPEKMKVRLGGAKIKPGMVLERHEIADNTRVNLVQQIENVFRRGVSKARAGKVRFPLASRPEATGGIDRDALREAAATVAPDADDRLSYADSLRMIEAGLIENPDSTRFPTKLPILQSGKK